MNPSKHLTALTLTLACLCASGSDTLYAAEYGPFTVESPNPTGWSEALPYYNMGNRYLSQGRFGEAAQKFQEAIDRYPKDADFHINLGVALRKVEDFSGAEQAFKAALKINNKDWMTWNNLGNAYLKQNRLKDTIAAFEQALKCQPPASEQEALRRDIGDIHKILRATGQEPLPAQARAAKAPAKGQHVTRAAGGKTVAANASGKQSATQTKAPLPKVPGEAPGPGAPQGPVKDWGYD